jgi:hypothetical protein
MSEYSPNPQFVQPLEELAPDPVYFPAGQSRHSRVEPDSYLYVPGPQDSQVDEPSLLKPPWGQEAHVSVAPVLNVLAGHSTAAVLALLAL